MSRGPLTPPLEAVREAWAARVHAEYRSAAFTQHLGWVWLAAGVSADLVAESHGVVTDELQHAADALAVLSVLGGDAPPLEEPVLALPWAHLPAREASLRAGLEVLALNESLAVPLFAAMRARATEGTVLGALDRIGADEPRHAALGWTFLHWAVSAWPDARSVLQQSLPGALDRLQRSYGSLPHDAWPDDDVRWAWGLLDGATYASVLQRHLRGTLTHRLTELGLTVASR